jgi:hypothetical protein
MLNNFKEFNHDWVFGVEPYILMSARERGIFCMNFFKGLLKNLILGSSLPKILLPGYIQALGDPGGVPRPGPMAAKRSGPGRQRSTEKGRHTPQSS